MTGQIPSSFIEDLLARTDLVDLIGTRLSLRRAGVNFIGRCPFHNEKTPSFTVNPVKQFYHCFGCGVSGDAIRFLTEHDGLHFTEAVEELASRLGLTVPSEGNTKEASPNRLAVLYERLQEAAVFYQTQLREHPGISRVHDYLKKRGFSGKIAKQFGLGFAPPGWDALVQKLGTSPERLQQLVAVGLVVKKEEGRFYDRFRDRILFPIRDRRGRIIGFGGRVIAKEGEPKYLNSPETPVFNKGQELYGLYEARLGNRALNQLIVVEGYLDVIALAQFEIKNVVATLGTSLTEKHVEVLFKQVSELIFCFDGDKAGQEAAKRSLSLILPHMKEGRRVRFMILPQGSDPDACIRAEGENAFLNRIDQAVHLSDFIFETLSGHLDLRHLDSRAQLISMAKPLLKLVPEGIFQQMLYRRLGELTGVEAELIQGKAKSKPKAAYAPREAKPLSLPPSPAHRAIALLLQDRKLAETISEVASFREADTPGNALLCEMVEILKIQSTLSIEALWEMLSDKYVSQYSQLELEGIAKAIPEAGKGQEFKGAIQRLQERAQEQAMELLLTKAKTGVLSKDEKAHLKNLLEKREKNRVD